MSGVENTVLVAWFSCLMGLSDGAGYPLERLIGAIPILSVTIVLLLETPLCDVLLRFNGGQGQEVDEEKRRIEIGDTVDEKSSPSLDLDKLASRPMRIKLIRTPHLLPVIVTYILRGLLASQNEFQILQSVRTRHAFNYCK